MMYFVHIEQVDIPLNYLTIQVLNVQRASRQHNVFDSQRGNRMSCDIETILFAS
eukprot:m.1573583 g.1573583  ORF g.1573583 m.1573583 type:complete len:54 (-) comp25305_c0_seq11:3628-3789(-)